MDNKFVHLHTHSHYSLLNALPKIPELVKKAKEYGMSSLALTDNGNMYGAIEFYKACKKDDIKPIIGVDFYVAARGRKDVQAGVDNKRYRLVLLAKNMGGYKNLIKLVTLSNLEGFYYKPRIDEELMKKYNSGIIAIMPSFSGEISNAIKSHDKKKIYEKIDLYKSIYGEDNFYFEITHHPEIENHQSLMEEMVKLAKETNTKIMASHDVYYINPDDRIARDTLTMVNTHGDISEKISEEEEDDFSFISQEKALEYFKDLPGALENTLYIASQCNLDLSLGNWVFPNIEIPEGSTSHDELKKIVYDGFEKRGVLKTKENLERVEYELEVIRKKGYCPYFLIVADLLKYARENGILSNIRGSVSGSMITYLSGITNIDPIEYEIPFERFLNPERPSPPDIDMDFADVGRDKMVDYTRQKYGSDKVAQIGTFGTMAARGAVRDVARALGHPYELGDKISKLIPFGSQGFPMTIERAIEENQDLKDLYSKDDSVKKIIDMAKKIEGCARHISIHAAGVVISPTELTDYTPLQFDPKGENKIITQYDMYSIEDAGLLKFDFLGLKNLTIISEAKRLIKILRGIDLNIDEIPIDDKKTFEMLARGETADLFQLNGEAMTKFLVDLKPTAIHDINAMVALYRPGPMQFIPEYIERKHHPEKISYLDPALEPILQKTYGILVYQDDLLMMAHKLAGYSWGEVDKFRKAVGKKIPEEMAKQKERFIQGCVTHSKWTQKKATEVWKWIEPFAAYGFNKAHSVSYGRIAYITAYLKANFAPEYMNAVLMSEAGEVEKVAESVKECKRLGIPVLPPDINESYSQFTVIKPEAKDDEENNLKNMRIRFGLVTIKNFGQGIGTAIIDERKKNGKFKSLADFLERVRDRNLNKKSLEALVMSGAMDSLGERGQMLGNMEDLLNYNKGRDKDSKSQDSLFGQDSNVHNLKLKDISPADIKDKLKWEKELLGLYVSGHPLNKFKDKIQNRDLDIKKIKETGKENQLVVLAGMFEDIRVINTKNNEQMAFAKLSDFSGSIDVVVFPRSYREWRTSIISDRCLAIKAKISMKDGSPSLILDRIKILD